MLPRYKVVNTTEPALEHPNEEVRYWTAEARRHERMASVCWGIAERAAKT